jgi:hypothetical protein
MNKQQQALVNEHEKARVSDYTRATFKRRPYETLAEYAKRQVKEEYKLFTELEGTPLADELQSIMKRWSLSLQEVVDKKEEIKHYPYYNSEESAKCFGFEERARELELNETYLVTKHGIFRYFKT